MNYIPDAKRDRDTRLENFTAELTSAVYPVLHALGPKHGWLKLELGLWNELTETTMRWVRHRPRPVSADDFETWREGLVVDLTESAFHTALNNGIKGSLLDLGLVLYRAVRLVTRRYSRVKQSE
jgi:hypothetical protein